MTFHIGIEEVCSVVTDRDTYLIGDTIVITYINAPVNSTLRLVPLSSEGIIWTVSGTGTKEYTFIEHDSIGTWEVSLAGDGCSYTKYIELLKEEISELIIYGVIIVLAGLALGRMLLKK